jgi:hypothetical protein
MLQMGDGACCYGRCIWMTRAPVSTEDDRHPPPVTHGADEPKPPPSLLKSLGLDSSNLLPVCISCIPEPEPRMSMALLYGTHLMSHTMVPILRDDAFWMRGTKRMFRWVSACGITYFVMDIVRLHQWQPYNVRQASDDLLGVLALCGVIGISVVWMHETYTTLMAAYQERRETPGSRLV